ncbi:MAG: D-aminoacyl-tRNA deacylase [Thermoplasmatota archaeon]
MTIVIISSNTDPASINIKNHLLQATPWQEVSSFCSNPVFRLTQIPSIYLVTINDNKIFHENIDKEIQKHLHIHPSTAIFLSRHRSQSAIPSLSVHPIGNYGDAEFGGKSQTLVYAEPIFMSNLLRIIKKNVPSSLDDYQICFEVTHHGPYLDIPTLFVEIGSTEKQWNDPHLGKIIGQSILELLQTTKRENKKFMPIVVGVGGGHYAPRFTDVVFEKNVAFGHMIPKYHIKQGNIDIQFYKNALEKTPNVQGVYIHKKSFKKSEVSQLKELFGNYDIAVLSSKEFSNR